MKEYIDLPTMADVAKAKEEGLTIEVFATSTENWEPWTEYSWRSDVKYRAIKPLPEYYSFEKDEKVMVSRCGSIWNRRHFSHVDTEGQPRCFDDGRSSFTAVANSSVTWKFCRRPTKEEMGE